MSWRTFLTRHRRMPTRATTIALACALTGGCSLLDPWLAPPQQTTARSATTPLIDYLCRSAAVPAQDTQVGLVLPIRVGLAFVPGATGGGPLTTEREALLAGLRDRFRTVQYVADVVVVPDYYLSGGTGEGFEQLTQLAALQRLDLIALVSYDQVSRVRENERALANLTIVGQFFMTGNDTATHTLLDLAVVEPRSRSLLLRAGGTSSLGDAVTAVARDRKLEQQMRAGFDEAAHKLSDNFATELASLESRVRAGNTPIAITRRAGGGALDAVQLLFLGFFVAVLARGCLPRRRRAARGRAVTPPPATSRADSR